MNAILQPKEKKFINKNAMAWLLIIVGILLRMGHYLENRSLWLDETWVALYLTVMNLKELFFTSAQDADYWPLPVVGFACAVKIIISYLGNNEYTLRLIPFICSLASLFLFFNFIKIFLNSNAALIALGLFSFSNALIYYASEVRVYSSDVCIILIVYLIYEKIKNRKINILKYSILGYSGAIAIWFSLPSVFILASIATTSVVFLILKKQWKSWIFSLIIFSFWLLNFLYLYLTFLSRVGISAELKNMWIGAFMPHPIFSWNSFWWLWDSVLDFFQYPMGISFTYLSLFL